MTRWLDIPGWEGKYQISEDGRCRSLDRTILALTPHGSLGLRHYRGRELRGGRTKKGYLLFCLTENSGKEHRYAHDLVLSAFVGPRPDGAEVCHNNGVRSDNRLANLRYDTRSGNARDMLVHGTAGLNRGQANGNAKLTEDAVRDIRGNYCKGEWSDAARHYDVTPATVRHVALGQTWRHIA